MNYIFIDASYFIFYRYYSLKKWFKFKYPESIDANNNPIDFDNLIMHKEFNEKFNDINNYLLKIIHKLKIEQPYKIIFAKDCSRCNIWRTKLYPNYKATRAENNEISKVFKFFYDNFKVPAKKYNYTLISHVSLEADDIIGTITLNLINNSPDKFKNIYIFTDDLDYLQLNCADNIHIYNLKLNNICSKSIGDYKKDLQLKILTGDKSDNIPPIHPKCGIKTAIKYIEKPELLYELFNKKPEYKLNYDKNKQLIDMNLIADKYKTAINSTFNKLNI
tara:strand:+ start:656 stop:1483 length:828 start_codon:yes stop_codon:yes gene_type:complete